MWITKVRQRYRVEAARADRYLPMFNQTSPRFRLHARELVDWAIQQLDREDRVIWFLRKARICDQDYLKAHQDEQDTGFGYNLTLLKQQTAHHVGTAQTQQLRRVLDYSWPAKAPYRDLIDQLTALEREEQQENDRLIDAGDPAFLTFADGWSWQLLDRQKCEREGLAMRHCGNAAAKPGDKILSLREPVQFRGRPMWKPHATFILNDGVLGEMKGFANQKPGDHLHRYIAALLKDQRITRVRGGGYAPKQNFKPTDLSPELALEVQQARPDLLPAGGQVDLQALADRIEEVGKWAEDYNSRNEDNGYREALYYRDTPVTLDHLEDDLRKVAEWFKEHYGSQWQDQLRDMSSSELVGMYYSENEIASMTIGEIEEPLPEDLVDEISELTDQQKEELSELTQRSDYPWDVDRDTITIDMGDARWILVLDGDQLRERVGQMLHEQAVDGTAEDKRRVRETRKDLGLDEDEEDDE